LRHDIAMDVPKIGRTLRVLRLRRSWRQVDLATAAEVTRDRIVLAETGRADRLTIGQLVALFAAVDASVDLVVRWRGEGADRLLDAGHAALVEATIQLLTLAGWTCTAEASFSVYGERGSIDILAWRPDLRIVLVVEVKTSVTDLQALLASLDRKARLALDIARDRGWPAQRVARLLVTDGGRTNRRRIATHEATFATAFPVRGRAARAWLRAPASEPFSGLILLQTPTSERTMRRRVRRPGSAAPTS
jgi:transcriptional regulator with XRE-family HTH domain